MKTKAGLWIDHRRAYVVTISDKGEETQQINSDVEKPVPTELGNAPEPPDHSRGIVVESTQERKSKNRLNAFYDKVLTALTGADSVLVIGPGEAKSEFQKRMKTEKFPANVVEHETADKMTDPQIAALVREHFKAE